MTVKIDFEAKLITLLGETTLEELIDLAKKFEGFKVTSEVKVETATIPSSSPYEKINVGDWNKTTTPYPYPWYPGTYCTTSDLISRS